MIRQRPQRLARNVSLSHKVACTSANTTQTKAGNGRNNSAERNLPTTPTSRAANTTQTKYGNSRNDCAEFTHAPTKSRLALHRRKHNTNKSRQRPQRLCGIYPRTHKSRCTLHHRPKPNTTTQTKAGNGRNDCAEFTHAPHKVALQLHHRPKHNTNKSRQRPQRLCGIYPRTHKVALHHLPPPNTTQTKAGNGRNDCAEFTHAPTVALHGRPKHKHKQKQPATAALIMRNFRTVDTKSQRAKTS